MSRPASLRLSWLTLVGLLLVATPAAADAPPEVPALDGWTVKSNSVVPRDQIAPSRASWAAS